MLSVSLSPHNLHFSLALCCPFLFINIPCPFPIRYSPAPATFALLTPAMYCPFPVLSSHSLSPCRFPYHPLPCSLPIPDSSYPCHIYFPLPAFSCPFLAHSCHSLFFTSSPALTSSSSLPFSSLLQCRLYRPRPCLVLSLSWSLHSVLSAPVVASSHTASQYHLPKAVKAKFTMC